MAGFNCWGDFNSSWVFKSQESSQGELALEFNLCFPLAFMLLKEILRFRSIHFLVCECKDTAAVVSETLVCLHNLFLDFIGHGDVLAVGVDSAAHCEDTVRCSLATHQDLTVLHLVH